MALGDSIRAAESGGDPNAKNPNSSASGPDQFLDQTWLSTIKAARPDLAQGQSDQQLLALKSDPQLSGQMRDYYATQNQAILTKNGLPVTDGNAYLAHFAGPGGAVSVLKADPNTPVSQILGDNVVKANPFLANMTAGQLSGWANKKMGGNGAGTVPQAAQTAPPQANGILNQGDASAAAQPGVLNAPDERPQVAFQNKLAELALQARQPQAAPSLSPIQMAVPKGISRARLLAAINQPLSAGG